MSIEEESDDDGILGYIDAIIQFRKDHPQEEKPSKYIDLEMAIEAVEKMKDGSGGMYFDGHDYAIERILELLKTL